MFPMSRDITAWAGEDSNLRRLSRQIYSLLPLATRTPTRGAKHYRAVARSERVGSTSPTVRR